MPIRFNGSWKETSILFLPPFNKTPTPPYVRSPRRAHPAPHSLARAPRSCPVAVGRDVPIAPPRRGAVRGSASRPLARPVAHRPHRPALLPAPRCAHHPYTRALPRRRDGCPPGLPARALPPLRPLTARLWRLATPQWLTAQRFPFLFHRIFNTIRRTCFHSHEVFHASFCRFVQRRLRQRSSYI